MEVRHLNFDDNIRLIFHWKNIGPHVLVLATRIPWTFEPNHLNAYYHDGTKSSMFCQLGHGLDSEKQNIIKITHQFDVERLKQMLDF